MSPAGGLPERAAFCPACGAPTARRVPAGDDRERDVCTACGTVHYRNPLVVVGTMVEHEGCLLLCRRGIEPALGKWTMPAGFLELGESLVEGARRETREEALADVAIGAPFALLDVAHIGQVYALFRATLRGPSYGAGAESLVTELVPPDAIAWDEIAFPVVRYALRLWVDDRRAGVRHMHTGVVRWSGTGSRYDAREYRLDAHEAVPLG